MTLTPREVEEHLERGIGRRAQYAVVPSGVPTAALREAAPARDAARASLGLGPDAFVIAGVGRLVPIKGFDLLVSALAEIAGVVPDAHVLLIGDGEERAALESHAAALGVAARLHITGATTEVIDALAAADVLAAPSRNEGMGRVLVEAMALGLPVVGTTVGGIPDVIVDECGRLVPPDDASALAAALTEIGTDPALRDKLGDAARPRAEAFSTDVAAGAMRAIYDRLVRAKGLGVTGRALVFGLLLALALPGPAAALERVRGVVHVHSDITTGDFSLEGLVGLADRQGIGALLLAENYRLRVEYGLPPFRALTRVVRQERSLDGHVEQYLRRVAEAQARLPHVLLIPGVEVVPHYYWTGSPIALDMTVHDTQKNLLVFGVTEPQALRALPVVGNPAAGVYGWQSLFDALPVLLLIPGVVLLARRRPVRQRLGRGAVVIVHRRAWLPGLVLSAVGLVALIRGWPFVTDPHPTTYAAGLAPYQDLIDRVEQGGGAVVWSLPEAVDRGEQHVGPVRVSWLTEPYADDLLRTFRYSAFGAVYEDTTTFEQPGRGWDRLLSEYAPGRADATGLGSRRVGLPRAERGQADRPAADGVPRAREVGGRRARRASAGADVRRPAHARARVRRRRVRGQRGRDHRHRGRDAAGAGRHSDRAARRRGGQ